MDVLIKTATITDLQKIQELNFKLFKKENKEYDSSLNLNWTFGEFGTKYFQDKISKNNSCVFIAIIKNKIIGYLCGGLTKAETYRILPVVAELENMFILDEFRSNGIGTKLYNEFLKWCKTKKVDKIRVNASAQNELAINFYKNNNFKEYALILEMDL